MPGRSARPLLDDTPRDPRTVMLGVRRFMGLYDSGVPGNRRERRAWLWDRGGIRSHAPA